MLRTLLSIGFLARLSIGCSSSSGSAINPNDLGYRSCERTFECGPGRYCTSEKTCFADCRTTADCAYSGEGRICTLFGQCLPQDGNLSCSSHADCPEGHYCNGTCPGGAHCGSKTECPFETDSCTGFCSVACGSDDDCRAFGDDQRCEPIGQCLETGWERWISPGEVPPLHCIADSQCKALGWNYLCNCTKVPDPRSGRLFCEQGEEAICEKMEEQIDFGNGPTRSPSHSFRGTWGMRVTIAAVTVGLPLVNKQNAYSSNLFLVKATHRKGETLELEEKLCDLKLINFNDDDKPFINLAWMVVPNRFILSIPIVHQTVEVGLSETGSPFETSCLVDLRGCLLENPETDPLPTRKDFDDNPYDPRIYDQDMDGNPGMTTLMDGVLRGEIYHAQRWMATYHGTILDQNHIRGLASVKSDEPYFSSSNPALIYDTTTEIHPQADRTYFRMMRLSDDASCADVVREANREDSWLKHTNHMMDVADP